MVNRAQEAEKLLAIWADWQRHEVPKLGYPSHSAVCATSGGNGPDEFDIMCDAADLFVGQVMDVVINELEPIQRMAVHHKWLHAVFRARNMELSYMEALESVFIGARRKGIA